MEGDSEDSGGEGVSEFVCVGVRRGDGCAGLVGWMSAAFG